MSDRRKRGGGGGWKRGEEEAKTGRRRGQGRGGGGPNLQGRRRLQEDLSSHANAFRIPRANELRQLRSPRSFAAG